MIGCDGILLLGPSKVVALLSPPEAPAWHAFVISPETQERIT